MVDDAKVLLRAGGADIWVVQQNTLGPFAEPSSLQDDVYRSLEGLPGVAETGNVAYLTMQVKHAGKDLRVMVAGYTPGRLGGPAFLIAGRPIAQSHYEAVADAKTGFKVGDRSHSSQRLHRGGAHPTHGVLRTAIRWSSFP